MFTTFRSIGRIAGIGTSMVWAVAAVLLLPIADGPPWFLAPQAAGQRPSLQGQMVAGIEVIGNRAVSRQKVVNLIQTRAGRPFDLDLIERDVRELNRSGMFVEVRPRTRQVADGVVVVFEVVERPTLQYIKFVGNSKVRDGTLLKESGLAEGNPLSPYEVEEGRRKIETYYRDRGFNDVRIEVAEGSRPTDRGAAYVINEGPSQRILWTSFVGNTVVSDARLKTQIQSKPGVAWVFKGYLDQQKIDEDLERLTAYYRSLGFFRARVGREFRHVGDGWVNVTFYIDEGPRYEIRSVSFVGNEKIATHELLDSLRLGDQQPFDQSKMNRDLQSIREVYGRQGYVFADVTADPRFLEEPGQLDLVYRIEEGHRYRIGRINVRIEGDNPHTRRQVVKNRISIRPGDIADVRQIRESQIRLQRSGLFEVEPARGIMPKIVFSRRDDGEMLAEPGQPRYRGQSPDADDEDHDEADAYEADADITIYVVPDDVPATAPPAMAPPAMEHRADHDNSRSMPRNVRDANPGLSPQEMDWRDGYPARRSR